MQHITGQNILILRGDGREWLAEQLQARGAIVNYCECYQRRWLPLDGDHAYMRWRTQGVDSVIISSGELLRHLLSLLPDEARPWWQQLCFIVPSQRVAMNWCWRPAYRLRSSLTAPLTLPFVRL